MFNSKRIEKFVLFFQPHIAGYASSWATNYFNDGQVRDSAMFRKVQSALTPPWYVFPIVWFILYTLIGYAAYRVFQANDSKYTKQALIWNQIQIFFNFLWMIIYFGFNMAELALLDLSLLWISVALMIYFYSKIDRVALYVCVPYLLWITFAGYLNYMAI